MAQEYRNKRTVEVEASASVGGRAVRLLRLFKWRPPVRIDVRRAAFTLSGVTSALVMAAILMIREPADEHPRIGFGWEWRTGTIVMVPVFGDECRRSLFDNDTGAIWPTKSVSCIEALGLAERGALATAEVSHVMLISQNFRR
jgi:hypothetical protein